MRACGASCPVGPAHRDTAAAISSSSDGAVAAPPDDSATSVHLSVWSLDSHLNFGQGPQGVHIEQVNSALTWDTQLSSRWSLQASAGALLQGTLGVGSRSFAMDPGFVTAIAGSYRWVQDQGNWPFVDLSLAFSLVAADTHETTAGAPPASAQRPANAAFLAEDFRFGITVGKTLGRLLTPYLSARVFGGPAMWHLDGAQITGTDTHHYQLAGGFSFAFAQRWSLTLEGAPFGEQRLAASLGLSL